MQKKNLIDTFLAEHPLLARLITEDANGQRMFPDSVSRAFLAWAKEKGLARDPQLLDKLIEALK